MTKLTKKDNTVSKLYEEKTGKKWSTAKAEGLTSGSYEDNMKLKRRLLSGEFDLEKNKLTETARQTLNIKSSYDPGPVGKNTDQYLIPPKNKGYDEISFKDAFSKARKELGAGKTFIYNGKVYSTNYAEDVSDNKVSNENNKPNKLINKPNKTIDTPNVQNKPNEPNKTIDTSNVQNKQNKPNKLISKPNVQNKPNVQDESKPDIIQILRSIKALLKHLN